MTSTLNNASAPPKWSAQQEAIFAWFEHGRTNGGSQHLIGRARAGTGKTTVILEGVKRAPERSILIAAFSKDIKLELERRIGPDHQHIRAMTLHALGLSCISKFRDRIKVDYGSDRADQLTDKVCGNAAPDAIKRLVSKLHTKGRLMAPHAKKLGELTAIAITFECEPDDSWANMGFDLVYVEQKALDVMALAAEVKSGETIDGSDMIFLPVRNRWLSKQFDLVVVDEAQDMTNAQLEIAVGVLKTGGRIAIVGDDRQAIFGFIGADSGSLDRLKQELQATELGLTTTYRCGKAIVELAAELVPDFQAGPDNPEGEILWAHTGQLVGMAGPGDFILSRINAPLVSTAMQLLRAGKRAKVAGRDIGAGLRSLIRKLKARSVPELLGRLEAWDAKETTRLKVQLDKATNGRKRAVQAKIDAIHDQTDMLISLAEGAKSVAAVEKQIDDLFTDDGLGALGTITCSSVHKAKGLEAGRVFILSDTLRDNTVEEQNIRYVAITRAKHTLIWVSEKVDATRAAQ